MDFIKQFSSITKKDTASAGGKGASLGEMTQAGIPVPPGFVILAACFERFMSETQIKGEINAILKNLTHKDMKSVEKASATIHTLILSKEIPKDIRKAIMAAFDKLGSEFVAVRSSATAEDSASAAWAGQLDTFLNTTNENLLENIKKCWASLFTARAIFYRFEKSLQDTPISVAVIIQKMVDSEVSGIAFSVHPVTKDRNQMIIEAGFGLGEAVVSGQITPDSYVLEKKSLKLVECTISEQSKGLFCSEQGGNEWRTLKNGGKQKLSNKQIIELATLIMKIEKHYGFPVDVEWVLEKETWYILQARPITTL